MGKLTARQEAFCIAYIETNNASEAYRRSYSVDRMQASTVWRRASDVLNSRGVSARIAELQAKTADTAVITLASHLKELARLRDISVEKNRMTAAIEAERLRGLACGFYTTRLSISTDKLIEGVDLVPYDE